MANTVIIVDMVRGFLKEGHPFYCGETTRRIIPGIKKLVEREIAGGSKLISLYNYHEPEKMWSIGCRGSLGNVRLDTPSERDGVAPDLLKETKARLDLAGHKDVKIFVSGGITPERMRHFIENRTPVDAFGVECYISGAKPIDFTADIHEIEGKPVAEQGRIPRVTPNPRQMTVM
jgi:nicotinic acid phosphoribosyltransferase